MTGSQQIVTGKQQLQPWKILNKGIKNFEDIVTVPDLQTKLGWYADDGVLLITTVNSGFSAESDTLITEEHDIIPAEDEQELTEYDITILRRNPNFNIGY